MEELVKIITENKLETVVVALLVNVLTAVIKLPIKKLSVKNDVKKYTGYIVFIPIVLAFILSVGYVYLKSGNFSINETVITVWLSSSSLSLAIYAIIEKVIPKNYVYMTDEETSITIKIIDELKALFSKEKETKNTATENSEQENIIFYGEK